MQTSKTHPAIYETLWTEQEKWAWDRIFKGKVADFNAGDTYGGSLSPADEFLWSETRVLTAGFIEAVLLSEDTEKFLTHHGVMIRGACFKEPLNFPNAALGRQLGLIGCRFEGDVQMDFLKTPYSVYFNGSRFKGKLNMEGADVGKNLLMSSCEFEGAVELPGLHVGAGMAISGSKFRDRTVFGGIRTGGDLFIRNGTEFDVEVLLNNVSAASIDVCGAKFKRHFKISGVEVLRAFVIRDGSEFDRGLEVVGLGASSIEITGSKFSGPAVFTNVEAAEYVTAAGCSFTELAFKFSKVRTRMLFSHCEAALLDLTGTHIEGELQIASKEHATMKWAEGARIVLRNTHAKTLRDMPNAWPAEVDLSGFTYIDLGGAQSIAGRDFKWLKGWLGRQLSFSPQPYAELGAALLLAGQKEKAEKIFFAGLRGQRKRSGGFSWLSMLIQEITVGYGYRLSLLVWWALLFTAVGVFLLQRLGAYQIENIPDNTVFSLGMMFPMLRIENPETIKTLGALKYYFYSLKVVGYFLISMLIAGVSGILKK
jgi:hypothetical protein